VYEILFVHIIITLHFIIFPQHFHVVFLDDVKGV